MRYESRVTIDVDGHGRWEIRALRAYYDLLRWCDRVDVRISSSGDGLHLIGWTTDSLTLDERLDIRRYLSDDRHRVRMDEKRGEVGHTTGVCWTEKRGRAADTDFDDIEAALSHIWESKPQGGRLSEAVRNGLVV